MYLTGPQSSHFQASTFEGLDPRENHFDWGLYYRFKAERERFWLEQMNQDPWFMGLVEMHFREFQESIEETVRLLRPVERPVVLDVGLSSEQLDRSVLSRLDADLVVLDLEEGAAAMYETVFGGKGRFVLQEVVEHSKERANHGKYDLVYSVGLVEHFPDKSEIVGAHVRLARPGGYVLIYAPVDSPENRKLTGMVPEWENFGYRELLTPSELSEACAHAELQIVSERRVGFFSVVWARRKIAG